MTQIYQTPTKLVTFLILITSGLFGSVSSKLPNSESTESDELLKFSLDSINIKQFLGMISGVIKIGNHTIKLPQDLPKLIRGSEVFSSAFPASSSERSFRHKYGPFGGPMMGGPVSNRLQHRNGDGFDSFGGDEGWGWGEEKEKGSGLISLANFFRLGCVIYDIAEIKKSAENGLY
jgi:hypothetical protein